MNRRMLFAAALALAACHGKQPVTAPPEALRPDPEPDTTAKKETKDCEPIDPQAELKPITFGERSINEAQGYADTGQSELKSASSSEIDRLTQQQQLTAAVNDFLTALAADPYNVTATYGLAAAYARIDRKQCSINMLTRLMQMRAHPSKKTEVEASIDHLLGHKQALDANFADMRRDDRFRAMIAKMCEATNDAACVYGTQR